MKDNGTKRGLSYAVRTVFFAMLIAMLAIISGQSSDASNCYLYDHDESGCESQGDCQWNSDGWGT